MELRKVELKWLIELLDYEITRSWDKGFNECLRELKQKLEKEKEVSNDIPKRTHKTNKKQN